MMDNLTLFDPAPEDIADTSDDWYTPRWLFDAAGLVFAVDVSAPVDPARRTCPARRYLTPIEDGLTSKWDGLVWMNPPWSRSMPWVERFARHDAGGLALLPATRSIATQTMLRCADAVTFFTGQFSRPNGNVDHNPWLLILAARGDEAIRGLERVAGHRQTTAWYRPRVAAGDVLSWWGDRPLTETEAKAVNRQPELYGIVRGEIEDAGPGTREIRAPPAWAG